MAPSDFRVIVVGGGPNGLTAAHMLSKAGIDFVVLEKRDTCMAEVGASLVVGPNTARVYDQLGLLGPTRDLYHPLFPKYIVTHQGVRYDTGRQFEWVTETHGHRPLMMHRPDLVKMLYDRLSDDAKARVLTKKGIVDIETRKDGVVVKCADGTEIKGSVVIGADGAHSKVRDEMRRLALKESPTAKVNDEKPLLTSYRCLFGTASLLSGLHPGELWGGHGPKASTQTFVGKDRAWFFVYEELDKPTRERHKYSKKDIEQYVDKWGHLAITDTLKVKDLYAVVQDLALTDLQEGSMKVFTWNRIVLVGDAVCKHTPNAGLGYNSGVQDLVVVVNGLYRLLQNHPAGRAVDTESIEAVFQQYQKEREKDSKKGWEGSYKLTRMQAFATWGDWLMERWVIPKLNLGKVLSQAAARRGLHDTKVLSFLEEKELVQGTTPWVHYPDGVKPPQQPRSSWGRIIVGALIVGSCLWFNRTALLTGLK